MTRENGFGIYGMVKPMASEMEESDKKKENEDSDTSSKMKRLTRHC